MGYQAIEKVEAVYEKPRTSPVGQPIWPKTRREELAEGKVAPAAMPDPFLKVDRQQVQGVLTQTYVRFIVDDETKQIRVQVVDASNDEVIREIPSEELAKLSAGLRAYNQAVSEHRR